MKQSPEEYITSTYALLEEELTDEPQGMKAQLRQIDGKLGYCFFLLAKANATLDTQEDAAAEIIKPQDLKAFAFEVKVKAMVSGHREWRDRIQGLIEAMQSRIMLGEALMKDNRRLPQE